MSDRINDEKRMRWLALNATMVLGPEHNANGLWHVESRGWTAEDTTLKHAVDKCIKNTARKQKEKP